MTLALLVLAKNEAHRLPGLLAASRAAPAGPDERIVLADVDSRDGTVDVAQALADRCYPVRFPDSFGAILTMGLHLCGPNDTAVWIDCDESVAPDFWGLARLLSRPDRIVCARRRRWRDGAEVDPDNPDWQPRVLPVDRRVTFRRRLHPEAVGLPHLRRPELVIDHWQDAKTAVEMGERSALYRRLAAQDGIAVEGGQPLDAVCSRCGQVRGVHEGAFAYATPPFRCTVPGVVECGGFT